MRKLFTTNSKRKGYTTMKTLLILPTTVLEQTMNNMKQCIMKSTLVINHLRACAARVTVVVLCVCLSVCLSVSDILALQATRRQQEK